MDDSPVAATELAAAARTDVAVTQQSRVVLSLYAMLRFLAHILPAAVAAGGIVCSYHLRVVEVEHAFTEALAQPPNAVVMTDPALARVKQFIDVHRGKPVEATLRQYFREPIWEGHIPPRAENLHEAVVQSLVSWHRKVRDYEDAELPPWVLDWEARHPGDASEAADILSREPAPARKIPKGEAR